MHNQEFLTGFCEFARSVDGDNRLPFRFEDCVPCTEEAEVEVTYNHRYLLHTGWAARILANTKPILHTDVGSCSYFVTIASAFVPLISYDLRPMNIPLPGMTTRVGNLTSLPFRDGDVHSLSCMHALEHVGLGRYYDRIDPNGDLRSARELARVLAKGGNLLIVLPVGQPKIAFNAHRIYSYQNVVDMFYGLTLKEFSFIPTNPPFRFIKNANPAITENEIEGAGCFWFVK
jgi:SAM-dependent methyltransferase